MMTMMMMMTLMVMVITDHNHQVGELAVWDQLGQESLSSVQVCELSAFPCHHCLVLARWYYIHSTSHHLDHRQDIFLLLPGSQIRRLREDAPSNFATLLYKVFSLLYIIRFLYCFIRFFYSFIRFFFTAL